MKTKQLVKRKEIYKKIITMLLTVSLCLTYGLTKLPIKVQAAEIGIELMKNVTSGTCGENLEWTYEDGVLTISGMGKMQDYVYENPYTATTYYYEKPWDTFVDMTDVVIEHGVTYIGSGSFRNCKSLKSVVIPESVTGIGFDAFENCSISSIEIPSSIITIGKCAFAASSLSNIEIPSSVTSIEGAAFYKCSSLKSVKIGDGLKCIEMSMFNGCSNLEDIEIPDSITEIEEYAFNDCNNLSSIEIPSNVMSIGGHVFQGCNSLTCIVIPASVEKMGYGVFNNCGGLSDIKVDDDNSVYDSREACNAIIETQTNTLIRGGRLTKIPDSVTCIDEYAFSGASNLDTITISENITRIGKGTFSGCDDLVNIIVDTRNTVYDSRENCNAIIETTSNTLRIGCKNTTIPASVTSISESAFEDCSSLSSVTIPASVTSIGQFAFKGCSSISSVIIPESVKSIVWGTFWGCISLSSVTIPEGVTSIEGMAFEDCSSDLVIRGAKDSYAQRYALENNISFKEIVEDEENIGSPTEPETPSEPEKPSESEKPTESQKPSGSQNTPPVSQTPAVTAADQKISAKNFSKTASTKAQSFKLGATASTTLTYASNNKNIKVDADGKVTIAKNYAGKATITIHAAATSAYNAATAKVKVTVKPAKVTASKITAKAKKKAVTVKFSKAAGAKSYKVEVATDKKFKKNVKSVTVKKTTATIKSLKAGKKYYVRVTAIGNNGVKASAVVAKKTVKIK